MSDDINELIKKIAVLHCELLGLDPDDMFEQSNIRNWERYRGDAIGFIAGSMVMNELKEQQRE